MNDIFQIDGFLTDPGNAFDYLINHVAWDDRMAARKTASYGSAYNYSQMSYPFQPMVPLIKQICIDLVPVIGFEPNNCLINYYLNGRSKMGFHADQIDILEKDTGVAIVSLGQTRTLRFRNIQNKELTKDFELVAGSLLYMPQNVQTEWEHAIIASKVDEGRISLTFRKITG